MPDNGVRDHKPHFPETDGGREFVAALREAVVPGERRAVRRRGRAVLPPVALLTEGEQSRARARRVLRWLDVCLHAEAGPRAAKLVPHALLTADELAGDRLVTDQLVARLVEGVPPRTGRLPFPNYLLMRDVAAWLRRPDGADAAGDRALRDHCYARLLERDGLRSALWWAGGRDEAGGGGGLATLWHVVGHPLCQVLPRWWWARRRTRRVVWSRRRGWYARAQGLPHGRTSVEFFSNAVTLRADDLDRLLLHALFDDLTRATRPTRVSPWRRRRATRYTLLLELPPDEGPDGPVLRFLDAYREAVGETSCTATLLLAVGPAGSAPPGETVSPREAAHRLATDHHHARSDDASHRPLRVPLPANDEAWPVDGWRPRAVVPRRWRTGPSTSAVAQATVVAAALVAGGLVGVPRLPVNEDDACLGSSSEADGVHSTVPEAASVNLPEQYDAAEAVIEEQNARAAEAEGRGDPVRTIVYVGAAVTADEPEDEQRSDGAVPELRGIALAQREVNDGARDDDDKVWLRVEILDAGKRYENAVGVARGIVAAAKDDPDIVGVVGFRQSRTETKDAVEVLGGAGIPVVATTATADEMATTDYYHQLAPSSSREAEVVSEFVGSGAIVENGAGGCVPADVAIVVHDPEDLYSRSLADRFVGYIEESGGTPHRLGHTPDSGDDEVPAPADPDVTMADDILDLTESVCELIQEEPGSNPVVYWTSRSREFQAFLDDFGDKTTCEGTRLTVVGGNELTNAAMSGQFTLPPWLRFYYTARSLPVGDDRNSDTTAEFHAAYAEEFEEDDVWRDDGHQGLAYDAVQVMAMAVNEANRSTDGTNVNRTMVQSSLYYGVEIEGASGHLSFPEGEAFSVDKPLAVVHLTQDGAEPVLACGWTARNTGRLVEWGPDGEFDCPTDG
ncbi:hypothetical protein [Streptomyces sp. B6B3]|uniref:ABC transporter substrate-binding protein n=1 Tax=Streptomyces sp. B6B3 TaxID=3153570 RepID=UPI00325C97F8